MLHDNNTPLAAIAFDQWHPNGATMAVVSARARLAFAPDSSQVYEPDVELVLADTFQDDPHKSPMQQVNDLIPFKPTADVTVLGSLRSQEPASVLMGRVAIHGHEATIRGRGPRHWFHDGRWRLSEAEEVEQVDLSYSLAAGGRIIGHPEGDVDPENPIGAGIIHPDFTPRHLEFPAAQLEDPMDPVVEDIKRSIRPAGWGPVAAWWARRLRYAGTYDKAWEDNVHPRLPADFDYRHYQVGGMGLVLDQYLLPGMEVRVEGLLADAKALTFRIPDITPVASFSFTDGRFVKSRLRMDGIHLDLREETPTYDLTFRTWIETCPSLYRVDLDLSTLQEAQSEMLPVSGLEGLVEA